jgi:subtilisin family serine protease
VRKPLVALGAVLLAAAFLCSPLVPSYGAEKGPIISPRLENAIASGVENLRVIVWFEHHSTLEERLRDIAVALLGLENVGGTVVSIAPLLSASTVSIPRENLGNLLARPGVRMVDLDFEVRALEEGFLPPEEIAQLVDAEALPGDGTGVDVFVLDTGAPPDLPVDSAVSVVGTDPTDYFGHGSAVIGIIKTLAPGARIHSVKCLRDDGSAAASDILKGLEWCLRQPGEKKVINASLGAKDSAVCSLKDAFTTAILTYGFDAVAAAGNDPNEVMSPASARAVVGVGAVGADNRLTYYSSRVFDVVSYGNVVATAGPLKGQNMAGTSFASPVVAALAARYMSSIRGKTSQVDLVETLKRGSVRTPEGYRLVTASALEKTPPVPETTPLKNVLFLPLLLAGLSLVLVGLMPGGGRAWRG